MKKILIAASDMELGGAERALLGLLDALNHQKYHIDLFLMRHEGPLMAWIPKNVHLLPEKTKYADLAVPMSKVILRGHIDMVYGRLKGKIKAQHYIMKQHLKKENSVPIQYSFKYTLPYLPEISNHVYDLAIGFTLPYYIIEQKVTARKKIVWVHTDYTMIDGNREEEFKIWNAYDYIVSVSDAAEKAFLKTYPVPAYKMLVIENILLPRMIREQAVLPNESDEWKKESDCWYLLSIGRLTYAKNFDNIPDICARLVHAHYKIKWYIIGFGKDQTLIEKKIQESHMEEHIFLLGKKTNPYPYIRNCDIYIQPSRYEGKAVAVREAQILAKPVVITHFPTAENQLKDGINGLIVPLDNAGCAKGIASLLADSAKQKFLIRQCQREDFSNKKEALKIDHLF